MRWRLTAIAALVAIGSTAIAERARPTEEPQADVSRVTAVVRTDLGQLKWVVTAPTPYTPIEEEGRRVYLKGGCMYCHSQYVRPISLDTRPWGPVSADTRRWGPVGEAGELAYDRPRMLGPGGIGPDLSREGLKYSDEWHLAHFWNPPMLTQGSIMAGFSGLFDTSSGDVKVVDDPAAGAAHSSGPQPRQGCSISIARNRSD